MDFKELKKRLPLINSDTKGVRIVGYLVYLWIALWVITLIVPHPPEESAAIPTSSADISQVDIDKYIQRLENPNENSSVRTDAAISLWMSNGDRTQIADAFREVLNDKDADVRGYAASGLGKLARAGGSITWGDVSDIDQLNHMANYDSSSDNREAARDSIARISQEVPGYSVSITSDTHWSGSVGGDGNTRTVEGTGDWVIPIEGNPLYVGAVIQKKTASGDLTVQIRKDGEVVREGETTASYGVVTVTG